MATQNSKAGGGGNGQDLTSAAIVESLIKHDRLSAKSARAVLRRIVREAAVALAEGRDVRLSGLGVLRSRPAATGKARRFVLAPGTQLKTLLADKSHGGAR